MHQGGEGRHGLLDVSHHIGKVLLPPSPSWGVATTTTFHLEATKGMSHAKKTLFFEISKTLTKSYAKTFLERLPIQRLLRPGSITLKYNNSFRSWKKMWVEKLGVKRGGKRLGKK